MYMAVNVKNSLDIVPLFRDIKDPVQALEDKRFPVLKILEPINSLASDSEKTRQNKKSYKNIYENEIKIFMKRQWGIVDKINEKLLWGQCTPALHQMVQSISDYKAHEGDEE